MPNNKNVTDEEQIEIIKGLKAANDLLKNTITILEKDGIYVKINGRCEVLDIKISKFSNEEKLSNTLKNCINEAIQINKDQILKEALNGMPKK